eukprot:4830143-Alexandrium_andersonii.AAC.1
MDADATKEHRQWLVTVLHQASFRVYAWEGLSARPPSVAAAAITRAAGRGEGGPEPDEEGLCEGP